MERGQTPRHLPGHGGGLKPLFCTLSVVLIACQGQAASEFGRTPNIVLISVDGLRADRTGFGGGSRDTSPNMDAFARQGIQYDWSFSQSNESLLSHASMFTARYPSEIAWPHYLTYLIPENVQTLPEILQGAGYATGSFNAAGHIKSEYGFAQGFDTLFEGLNFGSFFESVPPAIAWLDERPQSQPFFMFLHGYDLHRPYVRQSLFNHPFDDMGPVNPDWEEKLLTRNSTETIFHMRDYARFIGSYFGIKLVWHQSGEHIMDPGLYLEMERVKQGASDKPIPELSQADLKHAVAHYDGSVLSADTYVGLFLEALVEKGLWQDTLVVLTSDHGEDLQDHGYFNHRAVLFDSTTHVPLILGGGVVPEEWRGMRRNEMVQAIDIVPTLAEVAGLSPPAGVRGRSLIPGLSGPVEPDSTIVFQQGVLGHSSARTSTHRLVFRSVSLTDPHYRERLSTEPLQAPVFQLFDLRTDENELDNVLDEQLEVGERLRAEMVAWYGNMVQSSAARPVDEKVLERLQRRGYW